MANYNQAIHQYHWGGTSKSGWCFFHQFRNMVTVEMAKCIVHETKRYAEQLITLKPDPMWTPVSLEEFWPFIGNGMNVDTAIKLKNRITFF